MNKKELRDLIKDLTNSIIINKTNFSEGRTFDLNLSNKNIFNFTDTVIHLFPINSKIKNTNNILSINYNVNIGVFKLHEKGVNRNVESDNTNLQVIEDVVLEFLDKITNSDNLNISEFNTSDYPVYNESSFVLSATLIQFNVTTNLNISCV